MDIAQKLKQVTDEALRLMAIVEIGKLLNSSLHLDTILRIILDTALRNLQADRGTLYLIDHANQELWSKVLEGEGEIRMAIGTGIAGSVALTGQTVLLDDAYSDNRFNPEFDRRTGYLTKSMLCAPMRDRHGNMIGVFQILNKISGTFNENDIEFLNTMSVDACIAIENARLHEADVVKQRMEKELEVAATIQRMILPKEIRQVSGFEIAGLNVPSRQIGGDYYDALVLHDGRVAMIMADVSGKSVPGALLVSTLQASLRAYLESPFELKNLIVKLNQTILRNSTDEKFITCFLAIADPLKKTLEYVNAGHNPPLLIRGKSIVKLTDGGIPLGMMDDQDYVTHCISLQSADLLVMFTDGITEATDPNDEMYGDERLESLALSKSQRPARELKTLIFEDVKKFENGTEQADDITLLIVKVD